MGQGRTAGREKGNLRGRAGGPLLLHCLQLLLRTATELRSEARAMKPQSWKHPWAFTGKVC